MADLSLWVHMRSSSSEPLCGFGLVLARTETSVERTRQLFQADDWFRVAIMSRVLLTGFGPYGNTPTNPAEAVAKQLDGETIGGAHVASRIVPCEWFKSIDAAAEGIRETKPEVVIMLGEYGGRAEITVERLAHNLNDSARYALEDNDGVVLQDALTAPDGPVAYYATAPIRAMVLAMREAGIPADISDTPGTLVCNHLMYGVLHRIAVEHSPIRAGWVHLPHLPSVAALEANLGAPSMSTETAAEGVRAAIGAAVLHATDVTDPVRSRWQI